MAKAKNNKKTTPAVATKLNSLLKKAEISKITEAIETAEHNAVLKHLELAEVIVPAYDTFIAEGKAKLHNLKRSDFLQRLTDITNEVFSKSKFGRYQVAYNQYICTLGGSAQACGEMFIEYLNEEHPADLYIDPSFTRGLPAWAKMVILHAEKEQEVGTYCPTMKKKEEDTEAPKGGSKAPKGGSKAPASSDAPADAPESSEAPDTTPTAPKKVAVTITAKSDEDSGAENGLERGVSVRLLADGNIETTSTEAEVKALIALLQKSIKTPEAKAKFKSNAKVTVAKNKDLESMNVG